MAAFVSTIDIAGTPEEVFAFVSDPASFPQWQSDVVDVQVDGDGRFTTTRLIGGQKRTMTQEVTELDPPRRWAVRGIDGRLRPSMAVSIEPVAKGSRVTFELDIEGGGVADLVVPMVRRIAAKAAASNYKNLQRLFAERS